MMLQEKQNKMYIYGIQVLFVVSLCGAYGLNADNVQIWMTGIARMTVYVLLIRAFNGLCSIACSKYLSRKKININKIMAKSKQYIAIMVVAIIFLIYNKKQVFEENFLWLFAAYLITKFPEINRQFAVINYGVGMACSFFEGYLVHVIPSDGHNHFGLENNMATYEGKHTVVFPVKRLLIVITKSLFCPPDLTHFNKADKSLPHLEECTPLAPVEKSVAGVVGRVYKNSAYRLRRAGARPLYVTVECATPLHTLRRVLDKTAVYTELAGVDRRELVDDFCEMLESIVRRSPEYRGRCELVYFDDEDPTQNLADVLLDKIRELEPNFEKMIDSSYVSKE